VAVSGGADSTALLVALASIAREHGLSLHAAHLHHGLRGREADADRRFVRVLCARLGVPLTTARRDGRALMQRGGAAGEAGLRAIRREWLSAVARRAGAAGIATAHTADDQLETLLMRLARGTGLAGAAGMRPRQGAWLKPLLAVTRAEVEQDLRRHGLAWREDASNAAPGYLRNRIRHIAVPALLDALGVAASDPAARRAGLARRAAAHAADLGEARRALARLADRALARARGGVGANEAHAPAMRARGGAAEPESAVARHVGEAGAHGRARSGRPMAATASYDARGLSRLPSAVRRLALQRAWRESGDPASPGLTARHLAPLVAALSLRESPAETTIEVALPGGWRASIRRGWLRFGRAPGAAAGGGGPAAGRTGQGLRRGPGADARLHGNLGRPGAGPAAARTRRRPGRATAGRGRPAARTMVPEERS
jgi:tRNA(Ile)-lysidine synthetase-like protein